MLTAATPTSRSGAQTRGLIFQRDERRACRRAKAVVIRSGSNGHLTFLTRRGRPFGYDQKQLQGQEGEQRVDRPETPQETPDRSLRR